LLLIDKYAGRIYDAITCYDCMIIYYYILRQSYVEGMTNNIHILIFQISPFSGTDLC